MQHSRALLTCVFGGCPNKAKAGQNKEERLDFDWLALTELN